MKDENRLYLIIAAYLLTPVLAAYIIATTVITTFSTIELYLVGIGVLFTGPFLFIGAILVWDLSILPSMWLWILILFYWTVPPTLLNGLISEPEDNNSFAHVIMIGITTVIIIATLIIGSW